MAPSPSRSIAFASCLALTGCAFGDGRPWGVAELSLTAAFPAGDRVETDGGFAIQIDRIAIEVESVHLDQLPEGEEEGGFDPADPPSGFSLCHNGHCHDEDGNLVSYQEVARRSGVGLPSVFSVARL